MLAIFVIVVLFALVAFFSWWLAQQRRKELLAWAAEHRLRFSPDKQPGLDRRFPAFDCLQQGDNRYGYNFLEGEWNRRPFLGFDYHYATHSTDSKGNRETQHHYFSAVILESAVPLKPLCIRPESFFDKVSQFFGFDDINFESAEFSRKFFVKSPDRKWAYAVLHPRAIEFLLAAPVFSLMFDERRAIAYRASPFKPPDFTQAADTIGGLLDQLPEYLVEEQTEPPPLPGERE